MGTDISDFRFAKMTVPCAGQVGERLENGSLLQAFGRNPRTAVGGEAWGGEKAGARSVWGLQWVAAD